MRLTTRLVAGAVTVLVITVAILVIAAERALRADLEDELRLALEREARLVRDALPADTAAWQEVVTRLARATDHRITLVDSTGRVWAESEMTRRTLPLIPAHADRPEVRNGLAGQAASARRQSQTTGELLLYVAVPGGPGVVRVASDLEGVNLVVRTAQRSIFGAALLALLVGSLLALVAGNSVARPLRQISAAAGAIAEGQAPRFPRSGVPEVDALVQALREMHHQLNQRMDALRHEQAESAALVDAMVEGVLASDGRDRVIRANPAARRLLGYGATEALPALSELFRAKAAREVVEAAQAGAVVRDREIELDGQTVLISARPLPTGGVVVVLHDLTPLRRLETVRKDFVANVSHELKTPLTSISGYAETLLGGDVDVGTTRRFLGTILGNARRMQRLVDDQLDLSRIESGTWQPRLAVVDTGTIIREAWEACADRAGAAGVRLDVVIAPEAARLEADPDALRQVLVNLFDNAVRYAPAGSTITCTAAREGDRVRLAVRDTGPGIAREHLPRIFERFYRADAGRSREEGGTGLGLAIVRHLVEAHGGHVTAESELGRGTTIALALPAPARSPG